MAYFLKLYHYFLVWGHSDSQESYYQVENVIFSENKTLNSKDKSFHPQHVEQCLSTCTTEWLFSIISVFFSYHTRERICQGKSKLCFDIKIKIISKWKVLITERFRSDYWLIIDMDIVILLSQLCVATSACGYGCSFFKLNESEVSFASCLFPFQIKRI